MKGLGRFLILVVMVLITDSLTAQTNWRTGNIYFERGTTGVTCGSTYVITNTDGLRVWNEGWQNCRRRNWYQKYYSGYIYLWGYLPNLGRYGWYSEWREGYFWYFTWYDYRKRIW